jgi:hypothetical protein
VESALVTRLRLPRGELHAADGSLHVSLAVAAAERGRARAFFERVASFGARHGEAALLLAPATIEEREERLELVYACPETVGFAEAGRAWRGDLAARLPSVLALGRAVAGAGLALERAGWGFLPLTAPQIRIARAACEGGAGAELRVIALPPLAVTLADWAGADPEAWAWAPPEALHGEVGAAVGYAAGALLHEGIAGELWPAPLPRAERFLRLVRGRSGSLARLRTALAAALPKSLAGEAAEIVATAGILLDADRSQRAAGDDARARIAHLCETLTASRLAAGWEEEAQPRHALAVLERGASGEVAWQGIARLSESLGDLSRAIEAGAHALPEGDAATLRGYLALLGKVAAMKPAADEALLARGIALLDENVSGDPGDAARVYLAHLEARHLGRGDAARSRLRARLESTWCRALGAAIEARTQAEAEQYPRASRAARDGRALLDGAADGGGRTGRYLRAYLHLVDGIANFGAVDALGDPSFLRDAFGAFTQSLDLARAIEASDLVEASIGWLAHLREAAGPRHAVLAVGVDACFEARGLAERGRDPRLGARPALPWYDEATLFPAQVTS